MFAEGLRESRPRMFKGELPPNARQVNFLSLFKGESPPPERFKGYIWIMPAARS